MKNMNTVRPLYKCRIEENTRNETLDILLLFNVAEWARADLSPLAQWTANLIPRLQNAQGVSEASIFLLEMKRYGKLPNWLHFSVRFYEKSRIIACLYENRLDIT